jgi:hypothetical protein
MWNLILSHSFRCVNFDLLVITELVYNLSELKTWNILFCVLYIKILKVLKL